MMSKLKVGTKTVPVILYLFSLTLLLIQAGPVLAASQSSLKCTSCHGMPPLDSTTRDPATGSFAGNHVAHNPPNTFTNSTTVMNVYSKNCTKCHNNSAYTTGHYNGRIQMALPVNPMNNYSASTGKARYNRPTFFNQTSVPLFATCSNVNCHFEKTTDKWSYQVPANNTLGCVYCHGEPIPTPGTSSGTTHQTHYNYISAQGTYFFTCDACHVDPRGSAPTVRETYAHATSVGRHPIRTIPSVNYNGTSLNFLPSQTATRTFGTCSTIYCHSDGTSTSTPTYATPRWATPLPTDCTGCHGAAATSAKPITTGKHAQHINNAAQGGSFACVACHSTTVDANMAIISNALHVNQVKNYAGANAGTITAGVCANTYCHSNGQATPVYRTVASWSSATTYGCASCHGADTSAPGGVTTSLFGAPNYNNYTTAGSIYRNSHSASHISSAGSCMTCHYTTTAADGSILPAPNAHINNARNVVFDATNPTLASAVYNAALKTCTNTCHGSTTVKWGSTAAVVSACNSCHPNLSGVHARHMGALNWSALPFYAYTSVVTTGGDTTGDRAGWTNYGFGCATCHPVDPAKHRNGVVDVELAAAGTGFTDANLSGIRLKNKALGATVSGTVGSATVTCQNVYCHSNGKGAALTTDTWSTTYTAVLRCTKCHGNAPASTSHDKHVVGLHYDDIYNGVFNKYSAAGVVGKSAGHGDPSRSTTIGCYLCHNTTITTAKRNMYQTDCVSCHSKDTVATGAIRINNLAKHVNGSVDVQLAPVKVLSKAQLRPDAFANITATGGAWVRNGGYKAGYASFDNATTALNTAKMYSAGTCSNIACHNRRSVNWTSDYNTAKDCIICHKKL